MRIARTALSGGLIMALSACNAALAAGLMLFLAACHNAGKQPDISAEKVGMSAYAGGYAVLPADRLIRAASDAVRR